MSVNISYKNALESYTVTPSMTVDNLIEEIRDKQKVPKMLLKLGAVELLPTCLVRKYLLTSLTLCADDLEVPVEINDITLEVRMIKMPSQQFLRDQATLGMTVGQFKQQISAQFWSSQGNWVMKKDGQAVRDGDLLESLISKKTFTVLELIQVVVSDSTIVKTVPTHVDMTVAQFRIECRKKFDGRDILSMTFGGNYLEDSKDGIVNRMGSYGIQDNDTVIVVAEVPGGQAQSWQTQ